MTTVLPLRPNETAAWHALVRGYATVLRRMESELETAHGLSLAGFEVLTHLSRAPNRRIRMTELADCALLSRSGLTRLIDRLSHESLVTRHRCEADGRVVYAELTEDGYRRFKKANPTYVQGIRRYLVDRLSRDDLDSVACALGKLAEALPDARGPEG